MLLRDSVALRKESVDRNSFLRPSRVGKNLSLSARRAWIEISIMQTKMPIGCVALRKESVDRNPVLRGRPDVFGCRSPQGERG